MTHRQPRTICIFPPVRQQLTDIWLYTERNWGVSQADTYLQRLDTAMKDIVSSRVPWRKFPHPKFPDIFFIHCESHFIFFRVLSDNRIGIISVLHGRQDIPDHLRNIASE